MEEDSLPSKEAIEEDLKATTALEGEVVVEYFWSSWASYKLLSYGPPC